mgnify:FL=1
MDLTPSFIEYIEKAVVENWDRDALTDYKGITLQYHDVARKIEKLHILFANSGIEKGDKIALCGRNSSNWAVAFLATLAYGAVAVPIQNEFTPDQIYNIVNHSEARLLFVGDVVATQIDASQMPALEGVFYLPDFSLTLSRSEQLTYAREHLNEMFGSKFPKFFRREHVAYHHGDAEDVALINYTSGTTGFSKGVVLPYRALWSNFDFLNGMMGKHIPRGSNCVCILPMAHMYGLMDDVLFQFCLGSHIFFLTRMPTPTLVAEALAEIRPRLICSVPLVVEKIVRKMVFPEFQTSMVRLLMNMPLLRDKVKERICERVREVFGGNLYQIMVGGASLSREVEEFFVSIGFPITVGYGTTETAPMITMSNWDDFVPGSCGTPAAHMEVRIASEDPEHVPGEIITRGLNVMLGYYKNEEATRAVIDADGWFHTGDLATMSADGHVFIRGRIKNMLLGANGQNVYPEEIEDKLNSMALVGESLVVQRGDQLVALVHPDVEEVKSMGFDDADLRGVMEQNRIELNSKLPHFCKIAAIQLHATEFEKTPKKSIKRYKYQQSI